jgi:hypothetical protein
MRIPLPANLESRDGDVSQDARLKNCYIDTDENAPVVVKRAGLRLIQTTGDGEIPQGFFYYDGNAYAWFESAPPGNPEITVITGVEDEFRDFSYNLTINFGGDPDGDYAAVGSEVSASGAAIISGYAFASVDGVIVGSTFGLAMSIVETQAYVLDDILPNGTYLIEVKKEGSDFNLYKDGVIYLSLPVDGVAFTDVFLESEDAPQVEVSDLQFIT